MNLGQDFVWIEEFLLISIAFFTFASVLFVTLIFYSRLKKIRSKILRERLGAIADNILMGVLFDDKSFQDFERKPFIKKHFKKLFFCLLMIKSIMSLYQSYSGEYRKKLETFFRESGLVKVSLGKLKSRHWHIQCRGIEELSTLGIQEAYPEIVKCIRSRNETVKLQALIGIIRLKGLDGLSVLKEYEGYVNDWIQLNLLFAIKQSNLFEVPDLGYFLSVKNESIQVFGLRLIADFNQVAHLDAIRDLAQQHPSAQVKHEAEMVLYKLKQLDYL